jgi:methylphosphotriester-DNA--protein-cysteine methyltransferase
VLAIRRFCNTNFITSTGIKGETDEHGGLPLLTLSIVSARIGMIAWAESVIMMRIEKQCEDDKTMTLPAPDICYEALKTRNTGYDGQFVVAVKTTGIYCRPSCPSRLPKAENVTFYPLPAAAAHGFRACKRCQPKAIAIVDEQALRVQAICEYIQAHLDESLTLEDLSTEIYWSPFHLQRTFKDMMGITPRQYVEAQRMKHFKTLLKVF